MSTRHGSIVTTMPQARIFLRAMIQEHVTVSPPLDQASVHAALYAAVDTVDAENGLALLRPWVPRSVWLDSANRMLRLGYMLCTPPTLPSTVLLRQGPSRADMRLFIIQAALGVIYQYWESLGNQTEVEMRFEIQIQEATLNAADDLRLHSCIAAALPPDMVPEVHRRARHLEAAHQRARGVVVRPAGSPPPMPASQEPAMEGA